MSMLELPVLGESSKFRDHKKAQRRLLYGRKHCMLRPLLNWCKQQPCLALTEPNCQSSHLFVSAQELVQDPPASKAMK